MIFYKDTPILYEDVNDNDNTVEITKDGIDKLAELANDKSLSLIDYIKQDNIENTSTDSSNISSNIHSDTSTLDDTASEVIHNAAETTHK